MGNRIDDKISKYPSTDLAYELAKLSYDWMLNRLQAIDSKIQGLLIFATATTAAVPVFAKAINVNFNSAWFYVAVTIYVLFAILGTIGLRIGKVRIINPKMLYERWLHKTIWEFKKDGIYFAGNDFSANKKLIDNKSHLRDVMIVLLIGEILCIIAWIATTSNSI